VIRERGAPYRTWRAQTPKEGKQTEDYGVATRILDTEPGRVVIIIAGLSDYGTKAAAEFLGTERYLSSALSQLPTDWRTRNVQFVVRTEIIGRTTGPPAVLALHSW
jgi:hypothetical protein